jgi:pimeloyl-ACP methyl ester carboxylesterase
MAGRYRSKRLVTPTLTLYGGEDPNMTGEILDGHQNYADDLTIEEVDGASHFIADESPRSSSTGPWRSSARRPSSNPGARSSGL